MTWLKHRWLAVALAVILTPSLPAQTNPPLVPSTSTPKPEAIADPKPPSGNAAIVNGQAISEAAVFRALRRVPPDEQAKARTEILDYLIDNALIDQYLLKYNVQVDAKEVDKQFDEIQAEIKKSGQDVTKVLQNMFLTEAEFKAEIAAQMRWEKYVQMHGKEETLRELFKQNVEVFDGTVVRVRHILITPDNSPMARQQAQAQLQQYRAQIDKQVAEGMAKVPASADPMMREQRRCELTDEAFSSIAREKSACPSKTNGGLIPDWFPRNGAMVEPFARAAFALKSFEISPVIETPFGYHLILLTGRRPGQATKFEDVKEYVLDFYGSKVREALTPQLRKEAKIEILPTKP